MSHKSDPNFDNIATTPATFSPSDIIFPHASSKQSLFAVPPLVATSVSSHWDSSLPRSPAFPVSSGISSSSASFPLASATPFSSVTPSSTVPIFSGSTPFSSTSFSMADSGNFSVSGQHDWDLASYNANVLGLSFKYCELAKTFVSRNYSGFEMFIVKNYPDLLEDLKKDCQGGESVLCQSLRSIKSSRVVAGGSGTNLNYSIPSSISTVVSSVSPFSTSVGGGISSFTPSSSFSSSGGCVTVSAAGSAVAAPGVAFNMTPSYPPLASCSSHYLPLGISASHSEISGIGSAISQAQEITWPLGSQARFSQSHPDIRPSGSVYGGSSLPHSIVGPPGVGLGAQGSQFSGSSGIPQSLPLPSSTIGNALQSQVPLFAHPFGNSATLSQASLAFPPSYMEGQVPASFQKPSQVGTSVPSSQAFHSGFGNLDATPGPSGVGSLPVSSSSSQSHSGKSAPPPFRPFESRDSDSEDDSDRGSSSIAEQKQDFRKSKDYKRVFNYVTSLYPQALGVAQSFPSKRAVFEDLFSDPPDSSASDIPAFNWFDRVKVALEGADDRLSTFCESSRKESTMIPGYRKLYSVASNQSKGKQLKVNKSLSAHLNKSISRNRLVGISLFESGRLESAMRGQAEVLSHTMWMLAGLLGFIKRDGYKPSDQGLFEQLLSSVSIGLADLASSSASCVNFLTHKRRQFYVSHLPAYFPEPFKDALLNTPANMASSLFNEQDINNLLEVAKTCSSLRSQQAMVDVAKSQYRSRTPPRSPRSPRSTSLGSSSNFQSKRPSQSPSRSPKRVRFNNLPVSSSKSPPARRQNFRR